MPIAALNAAAASGRLSSLKALNDYFSGQSGKANSRFTALLTEVQIETEKGPETKIVAFSNKGGLPASVERQLNALGVQIYDADQFENHAEIAAQNFKSDTSLQIEELGGPIIRVNNAVMNNGACSEECAQDLTDYIGRENVTIEPGGRGVIGDEVLNPEEMAALRAEFGGVSNLEAIIQADPTAAGGIAGDPEGEEP